MAAKYPALLPVVIGVRADGRPIYLMQGGSSPETPSAAPVVPPGAPVKPADAHPEPDDDKPLGEGGEKALKAERKRAADSEKRANELEARVKEFEDKGKTDEQRRQEADVKRDQERDTATVKALRYEVCADKDLPLAAARFLTGATKAEIEEAADAFKALNTSVGKPATGLPPAPNAGRVGRAEAGAQGKAEAERRGFIKTSL